MQDDMMKHALNKRKQSLNLIIEIEPAGHDGEEDKIGLAPKGDMPLDGKGLPSDAAPKPDDESGEQVLGEIPLDGMSQYDKESLMNRKPRSLGERARQAFMQRKK